jgi:two-component system, OmpR family, alkaline phosphatase synthesis response regulator PhoP
LSSLDDARKIAPKRILIADDAPSGRALVRHILGRSGYEIFEAEDGEEALECARRFQPDLVILDLQMPKLDGCIVASRLRSMPLFEGTPILALSAAISQAEHAKLIQAGFSSFLAKPISPARLRSAVDVLFNGARVQEGT